MNDLTVRNLVHEWLYLESPHPSLFALSVNSDSHVAANAGTAYLGENNSDKTAQGVEIYSNPKNLPIAVSSILNHAQNRAGFHPASTSADVLATAFAGYINQIDKTPFLHLVQNESSKQVFYSKNYNDLIDQVVKLYTGVMTNDLDTIKHSITEMGNSVFGQTKSEEWKNIFSQTTLDFTNYANPTLFFYYTSLHMYHDNSGKSEVSEQDFEVRATKYVVLPDLIQAYAQNLATLDKTTIEEWSINSNSAKKENANLCFEVLPFRNEK